VAAHRADGSAVRRPDSSRRGRRRAELARRESVPGTERSRRGWVAHVPRAGLVGILGAATIVAPLVGDVLSVGGHSAAAGIRPLAASAPAEQLRVIPEALTAPESFAAERAEAPSAAELTAARAAADRATRDLERRTLEQQRRDAEQQAAQKAAEALAQSVPGCDPAAIDVGEANGRLDTAHLCELWGTGHLLRSDAAVALAELRGAYQAEFGTDLVLSDSYRSYAEQVSVQARKPGLAARAGTSEHGWGLAVDLAGGVEGADVHYAWLRENAPAYGWDNPDWALEGGSGPYEPWHWEYVAGQR
jgi:LAS superfamily LD-carboxypeptidase LdcB